MDRIRKRRKAKPKSKLDNLGRLTVREFFARFPDEDTCLTHIMEVRYGQRHVCGACGLKGHIEADETYVGGHQSQRPHSDPTYNKTIVMGLKERGGPMTTHVIPNVKTDSLRRIVLRNVARGSTVSTDELKSYSLLTRDG